MALFTMSSAWHIASSKTGLTIIDIWLSGELVRYGQFRNSLGSKLHLAAKRPKRKNYSHNSSLGVPIAEGQNKTLADRAPFSNAVRTATRSRYGGLLLSLTRPHLHNNHLY
jgi:hypothetical protein